MSIPCLKFSFFLNIRHSSLKTTMTKALNEIKYQPFSFRNLATYYLNLLRITDSVFYLIEAVLILHAALDKDLTFAQYNRASLG